MVGLMLHHNRFGINRHRQTDFKKKKKNQKERKKKKKKRTLLSNALMHVHSQLLYVWDGYVKTKRGSLTRIDPKLTAHKACTQYH